jgi:putative ATP-binding cassette transporter
VLQLRWRQWLTERLLAGWLDQARHCQLGFVAEGADNADQRIAENLRIATEAAVDFVLGLLNSLVMPVAFVGILWTIAGALFVQLGSYQLAVPGHMVWCALLYPLAGSALTWRLGRPLIDINSRRNTAEADFRFALVRVREASESIGLIRGEADERRGLAASFARLSGVLVELFRAQRSLMWLSSAYGSLAMVVPTLVASPRYFSGAITLGGLMQIAAAFQQVQIALNWFVDNFPRIAERRASVERVVALDDAITGLLHLHEDAGQPTITIEPGTPDELVLHDVAVRLSDGTTVIADATARIRRGERVLITGESGTGKSTLFRALAGLWPWGSGRVVMPPPETVMFMPQRPYLPLGTPRAALAYPRPAQDFADAAIRAAMQAVGLERHLDRLDEEQRWDHSLSLGEQQRLAFARLLLQRPAWVFMDEATSALDEPNQDAMMHLFIAELPESALVSIGHRPGLEAFHARTLSLQRGEQGARLVARRRPRPQRPPSLLRRAARRLALRGRLAP